MKKSQRVLLGLLLGALMCLAAACAKDEEYIYQAAIKALDEETFFAVVDIGATQPVLLVTDQVYDDGSAQQATIVCDVYYWVDGQVQKIGAIQSFGTAYPLAYDDSALYAAGGHLVQQIFVDETDDTIELVKHTYNETFDEAGESGFFEVEGKRVEPIKSIDYEAMEKRYVQATVIDFSAKK